MNKVGVPPGVYNVVNGFGVDSAGAFLTAHPDVNGITFTGETKTGTAIMKAGADGIRPVSWSWAARTPRWCLPTATSTTRRHHHPLGASRTAARSAWAPSACMWSARSSTSSSAALKPRPRHEARPPLRPDTKIGPLVSKVHQKKVLGYYAKGQGGGRHHRLPAAACPTCRTT
jgi:aminomuconate-semialdehyde/2-hydroxymuconate-6-semialdehyde dehydrogenase